MQLVAYGAQDIYLTGNPQITFFKVVYRRHTNFSVESIEQTFNGSPDFGKKVSCTISRNADLASRIYLETTLPDITLSSFPAAVYARWVDFIGEKLINYVEVSIGGQRIDRHYGEWLHIWTQLSLSEGQLGAYYKMIGNTPDVVRAYTSSTNLNTVTIPGKKIRIPLQFWFCRNPGLALPLIALQYHDVVINVEFADLKDVLINVASSGSHNSLPNYFSLSNTSLWVDYIFLDTDERRRFAQMSHEYLIELLQFPGEEVLTSTANKIRLNFSHPVKEMIWVAQRNDAITHKQWFNYSDSLYTNPMTWHDERGVRLLQGLNELTNTLTVSANPMFTVPSYNSTCSLAKIQINGQDRFAERDGTYFDTIQPFNHHTRSPHTGINVYSFALKPEEHQPSGSCNFSRVDNANLFITVTANSLLNHTSVSYGNALVAGNLSSGMTVSGYSGASNAKIRVYVSHYNILRIMSGMGGLAYST